eukprot:TRINITY_DN14323_c0_g1_i1.p1 TRINITY_DN14323_c0_g1~~TRINITY_DN14323_c0_g1_i1.p1  ORF type:complete len:117 (+),score=9.79 TRINITY_DN14323_c0_g1_i1:25-351(+)
MIRRPPRSTLDRSSAASDVYKRQAKCIHLLKGQILKCRSRTEQCLRGGTNEYRGELRAENLYCHAGKSHRGVVWRPVRCRQAQRRSSAEVFLVHSSACSPSSETSSLQ